MSSSYSRVRQFNENGEIVNDVTIDNAHLAGMSEDERNLIEVLDDENPLDRHHRPREASYPDAGTGTADPEPYTGTKDQLLEEIARRNTGRAEDDQIEVEQPGNKPQLVAALVDDDKRTA